MNLYYENQYIKEFDADIEKIIEKDGRYHIILNRTAFFPGGGGQFCDLGTIDNVKVIDVYEEEHTVYHVTEKKPLKEKNVKCILDWDRRMDGMQQHLAQHVLSGCFFKLFNANTAEIHIGSDISTVDIKGHLSEEQIREAEKYANKKIGENLKVDFLWPERKELKRMGLRRALPKTNDPIRVVKIGDLDINACCGIHPSSTLELRLIKIRRWEKHKSDTRIEFVAGNRAIEEVYKKDHAVNEICSFLNCGEETAIKTIKNISNNLRDSIEESKSLRAELSAYRIREMIDESMSVDGVALIKKIYEGENPKNLGKLASRITEGHRAVVLFGIKNDNKANLIFTCSKDLKKLNMNDLLKDSVTLIDGRGGGSPVLAQGAGKNAANLESTLNYAAMKVEKSL